MAAPRPQLSIEATHSEKSVSKDDADAKVGVVEIPDGPAWSLGEERKLVRKVDLALLPTVWIMSLLSYMDRANLGNAAIAGLSSDLQVTSSKYSLAVLILYVGYIPWVFPSNQIIARVRPSIYLPTIMILWGTITCCTAAIQTYPQLLALRVLLGMLEAGLTPGTIFVFSCWYRPDEQAKRTAVFISTSLLGGAFGSLIAGAVTGGLEGVRGMRGWRWLYLIEGATTIGWAIVSLFLLPDYPATCRRLTESERIIAIKRMQNSGIHIHDNAKAPKMGIAKVTKLAVTDVRNWLVVLGGLLLGSATVLPYFYPTLVKLLGFTPSTAQYMTVPIWMFGFVCAITTGFAADLIPQYRALTVAAALTVTTIMAIIICGVYNHVARYVLLVLMAGGVWSSLSLGISLCVSLFQDLQPEVRAFAQSMSSMSGNFAFIYGAYLFPAEFAPNHVLGFAVIAGASGGAALTYVALHLLVRRQKRRKHGEK
ncbi:pantothenate transporter liz1 [Lasiosphaeria hispida]|uniref:Pantothenate transporter liz1 n=1 Tax=Lasiosphaeria hispida TaxID=260671 RepID=A0AAJ0MF32_9PEZI|nr:pantothenate transporter liz1 [Lasiosphaeria hispida]